MSGHKTKVPGHVWVDGKLVKASAKKRSRPQQYRSQTKRTYRPAKR